MTIVSFAFFCETLIGLRVNAYFFAVDASHLRIAAFLSHSRHLDPDQSQRTPDDQDTAAISWPNYHSGSNGDYQRVTVVVISGALVTVQNERTGEERTITSNEQGDYTVTALKPPAYTIRATLDAFSPAEVSGIQLAVGQKLTLDFTLQPAGIAETITVEASAAEAVTNTSPARIGVNVDLREVGQLPINGRQLSQLYLQAPGSLNSGSGPLVLRQTFIPSA